MSTKDYKVVTPVNHDNKDYAPGVKISLEDDAAEVLLGVGAIEKSAKLKAVDEEKKAD